MRGREKTDRQAGNGWEGRGVRRQDEGDRDAKQQTIGRSEEADEGDGEVSRETEVQEGEKDKDVQINKGGTRRQGEERWRALERNLEPGKKEAGCAAIRGLGVLTCCSHADRGLFSRSSAGTIPSGLMRSAIASPSPPPAAALILALFIFTAAGECTSEDVTVVETHEDSRHPWGCRLLLGVRTDLTLDTHGELPSPAPFFTFVSMRRWLGQPDARAAFTGEGKAWDPSLKSPPLPSLEVRGVSLKRQMVTVVGRLFIACGAEQDFNAGRTVIRGFSLAPSPPLSRMRPAFLFRSILPPPSAPAPDHFITSPVTKHASHQWGSS